MSGRQGTISELSNKLQGALGTPEGLRAYSPFPFGGMNQSDSPIAMADQEFLWLENLLKIGNGDLRALWDHDTEIFTVPSAALTIIKFASFNISTAYYFAVFLSDGTAYQVNRDTGATKAISTVPGTFYAAGHLPDCCPSGGTYLLIANNHAANSYWIWDGNVLYGAGGMSPVVTLTSGGSGYGTAPAVTAFGGSGSGWTGVASVVNGSVVAVQTTSAGTGYLPGDTVQLQFSGGGSDTGAILTAVLGSATVDHLTLLSGGSGFTLVPTVVFSSGAATATAVMTPTGIGSITVGAGGSGYTTVSTSVSLVGGGGSGATAVATVAAGAVTAISITNAGSGYTALPTVVITSSIGGAGATATAVLVPTSVGGLVMVSHGSGYTSTPTISFTGAGGGTGATALAVLSAGSVASVTVTNGGSGFTGTPTLTFVGGAGTGATATAILTSGVITSVTVTAGGSGYTSVPAIEVSAGLNNAASGTVSTMPFGVSGGAIENYLSRVWLVNLYQPGVLPTGGKMIVSAPGSLTDFAISDGGVGYTSTDRYLRAQYNAIRQSNGYLYPVGDSSVSVISNVQTAGSTATTTFNYQNTDPQTGTNYRDSMVEYGRSVLFANQTGVYGLYGGAVTKISTKVDNIFQNAIFPPTAGAITPTSSVVMLYKTKCYVLALTILDPFTGSPRNVMLLWNEKEWFVASQTYDVKFIAVETINSNLNTWATDGERLFRLFAVPSPYLTKTAVSKLYGADLPYYDKLAHRFYAYGTSHTAGTLMTFNWSTNYGQGGFPSPNNPLTLENGGVDLAGGLTNDVNAPLLGFTFTSQTPDFSLYSATLTYTPQTYIG